MRELIYGWLSAQGSDFAGMLLVKCRNAWKKLARYRHSSIRVNLVQLVMDQSGIGQLCQAVLNIGQVWILGCAMR
jgi:hypothetical protein